MNLLIPSVLQSDGGGGGWWWWQLEKISMRI